MKVPQISLSVVLLYGMQERPMFGYPAFPNFYFYFIFKVRRYFFCSGVIL